MKPRKPNRHTAPSYEDHLEDIETWNAYLDEKAEIEADRAKERYYAEKYGDED